MPSLDRKVALVTGAGGGIGAAICHRLSKEGAFVVAADLSFDNASKVAEQVRQRGAGALPIQLDGEQPGTTPARFEIVPQALRVRVPA